MRAVQRRTAVLLAASFVGACSNGGGGASDASAAGETAAEMGAVDDCSTATSTVTIAGALAGTRTGLPATATSWSSANDMTEVLMSASFGTPFYTTYSFLFPGKPVVATPYTEATAGISCGVAVGDSAVVGSGWRASKALEKADQGTCTLTFTSLTALPFPLIPVDYCAHGTVQATVPADPSLGSTGVITYSATF